MNETTKQLKATKTAIVRNRRLRAKCERELLNADLTVPADKSGTMMKAHPLIRQIQDIDKSYIDLCKLMAKLEKEVGQQDDTKDFSRFRS